MLKLIGSVFLVSFLAITVALAQGADVLPRIEEESIYFREFLQKFETGDQAEQLATLQEVFAGENPELRISIRQKAFASKYERVRRAALRNLLNNNGSLQIDLELPPRPDGAQTFLHEKFFGLRFEKISVDPRNDRISTTDRNWSGRLIQDGLQMTYDNFPYPCTLTMKIVTPDILAGKLHCVIRHKLMVREAGGKKQGTLAARVTL